MKKEEMKAEQRSVFWREYRLDYMLFRKNVKNLNLRAYPDGRIHVSAHPRITSERVDSFVSGRAERLIRMREEAEKRKKESTGMQETEEIRQAKEESFRCFCRKEAEYWYDCMRKNGDGDFEFPSLQFRYLHSRWGSCTPARARISLNLYLMNASQESIRYVILHELCHMKEANHSARFWSLVERYMPEWKQQREALRKVCTGE